MQAGTRLNHYEILDALGEGGMGQVYRATDTRLKRDVAIKVLPPELAADPDRLARLEREAQVLAQLEHPNVAAVYGLEEAEVDGRTERFLVMQLAEGESVFLNLPGLQSQVARIVWTDKFVTGCAFDTPLADIVFDQIVARLK